MRRLAPVVVTVLAAAYFGLFLSYGLEFEDEGLILAQATRTLRGEVPYVDFETGYTPGVFYVNAALFRVFGERALPVRTTLLIVNSLTIGLLFALARRQAGDAIAAATALGYAAILPIFPGSFASFNVPYPSWYTLCASLGAQAAVDRHLRSRGRASLFVAGLLAGVTAAFKPNGGAFALIAAGLALALPAAADGHPDRRLARLLLVLAALGVLALPGMDLQLRFDALAVSFFVVASPLLLLVLGRLVAARARIGPPSDARALAVRIGLLGAGFLVPTLPWLLYFLQRLGAERFAREVLLLGLGFEGVFGTTYPTPFGHGGVLAFTIAAVMGAGAAGALVVRRRPRILPVVLVAIAAAAVVAVGRVAHAARMPEGLAAALVGQLQLASFFVVPPLGIAAVLGVLGRLRRRAARSQVTALAVERRLATLAFASSMILLIYPRIDEMHMIVAAPAMLVLGAALARRVTDTWAAALHVDARVAAGALVALITVVCAIAVRPSVEAALASERVTLASVRLPVHLDAARAGDLRAFDRIVRFVEARITPSDDVFAFPALGLVSFALGKTFPIPYDYFFAGQPDHRQEAAVVARLRASPPRFVITLNRRFGYFSAAPSYYFLLRELVWSHYALVARAGRYDVLERRTGAAAPPPLLLDGTPPAPGDEAAIFAWIADYDRERRHDAVQYVLANGRDAAGVAALAARLTTDETRRLLLLRGFGESGDGRVLPFVFGEIEHGTSGRVRGEAMTAFFTLLLRDTLAAHLFAGDGAVIPPADWRALGLDRWRDALDGGGPPELALLAVPVLGKAGVVEAVPTLERMLAATSAGPNDRYRRSALAEALVRLGRAEHLCDLVDLFGIEHHEVQDVLPSAVLDGARRHPVEGARCLARGLQAETPLARAISAYLVGRVPLPELAPALRAAGADASAAVRDAAAWALADLADAQRDGTPRSASPPAR